MMNIISVEEIAEKTRRRRFVAENDGWNTSGYVVLKQEQQLL